MAETYLTQEDEQRIQAAIENYVTAPRAHAEGGVGNTFCEHWQQAKDILEFLEGVLPAPAPGLIKAVVKIGDLFYRKCPIPA